MKAYKRLLLATAASVAISGYAASAAEPIGTTAAVRNKATGTLGTQVRTLKTGLGVFQKERIDTAPASTAQLMFNDETTMTIGPSSTVTLDEYVYDPNQNTGKAVVRVTKGAFRFMSGSADPKSYEIKLPVGTLGVRGTIIECLRLPTGAWVFILFQGEASFTPAGGQPVIMNKPYTYIVINPNGTVTGPDTWTGQIAGIVGGVTFPLFGYQWIGDRTPQFQIPYDRQQLNRAVRGKFPPPRMEPPISFS